MPVSFIETELCRRRIIGELKKRMDQGVDYAEMLEIPVSTVNVVKRGKKRGGKDLREKIIKRVNADIDKEERGEEDGGKAEKSEPARSAESAVIEGAPPEGKKYSRILAAEFVCAGLLCATIFLTNIFMSDSAINKFMSNAVNGGSASSSESDARVYSDFSLSPVVSELADVEQEISSSGVLSFTGVCHVYPACDGKVLSVTETDGLYALSISHSDSFESVISGLTNVYYAEGDSVKSNVPVGYTDGKNAVSVMLYSDDALLNCYTVNDENCLVWKS